MLYLASLGHTETTGNQTSDCRCCFLMEYGIPYHDTYDSLKAASDQGCGFCRLVRQSFIDKKGGKDSVSEEILQDEMKLFSRPVVLAPAVSYDSISRKQAPMIRVRVEPNAGSSSLVDCRFEAVAPRGMRI